MFDFAFTELFVIALIALIVVGPQRLPKLARQAGEWLGKLQRYVADVKSDISRQMELEELRNLEKEVKTAAREFESSVRATADETKRDFDEVAGALGADGSWSDSGSGSGSGALAPPPATDWDRVYEVRRARDRIRERRVEREKSLGLKRPKRRR